MSHNKVVTILDIPIKENSQTYFFLLATQKLGLTVSIFEQFVNVHRTIVSGRTVLKISDGKKNLLTLGATTSNTSYLGMKLAVDKSRINRLLKKEGIPTTEQIVIRSSEDLKGALEKFGKIILKPSASSAGKGVFSNISSLEDALTVWQELQKKFTLIVAERIVSGKEYRVLAINGKVFAIAEYIPPFIVGDGTATIGELIKKDNAVRSTHDDTKIKINEALTLSLADMGLDLNSIPHSLQKIILHKAAPISNGGYAVDVTEKIHPQNTALVEKIMGLVGLDIAGVDIITEDISIPINDGPGAVIEVNGGPDLDIHFNVREGLSRNGAEAVLKDYFHL